MDRVWSVAIATSTHQGQVEHAGKIVWALAWPAVALNSLQVFNNLLDAFFVGHLPEKSAMTAHGGSTIPTFLLFSLAMALATSATAMVSRAFGAGNAPEYREASRQNVSLSILGGLVFLAVGVLTAPLAARAFLPADDPRAIELMSSFIRIWALGLPAIYFIQALAGSLRGIGDTKSPMVISGLQILLHIGLNYLLIFPPRELSIGLTVPGMGLGLPGAALALTISAWSAAIVYVLYSARTPLGASWHVRWPKWDWTVRILRIAAPAALMAVLRVGSLAAFVLVLKEVPNASDAIGAMRAGFAIESIMFMPAFGFSVAASALVGQSLGMKKPDRAERLAWIAGHYAAAVISAVVVPIFVFAPWVSGLLLGDKPSMVAEAASLIRWLCVTEIAFGYAMVTIGALQGAGDTIRPMWITVISLWGMRVPMSWLLALPLGMGATGAWIGMSFTQLVQGTLAVLAFRDGKWKDKEV